MDHEAIHCCSAIHKVIIGARHIESGERKPVSMRAKICEPVSTDLQISSNQDHGEHRIPKEMVSNSAEMAIYHPICIFSKQRNSVDNSL